MLVAKSSQFRLSVLDQSPSLAGRPEDASIRESLALAQHCEALGYERYWVSEHHAMPGIAGSAPEVLLAAIAARTERIRLGSAGVMLPHYSAYKVAEQFRVLEALAPGRIDLGVGRAPGGDRQTAALLNPHSNGSADDFPEQVRDLIAWTSQPEHRGVAARPLGAHAAQVWMLGSSSYGAQLAAYLGVPYAFAYFFSDGHGAEEALALYRHLYRPSARHPNPEPTLCVWALAAQTDEEAKYLALSRERWRMDRQRGMFGPLRPPEAVQREGFAEADAAPLAALRSRALVGSAGRVAEKLLALAGAFGVDHLVVNTWAFDPLARQNSYALLAEELALREPA